MKNKIRSRAFVRAIILCLLIFANQVSVLAAPLSTTFVGPVSPTSTNRVGTANLDLTSTKANLSAPAAAVNDSLKILVGGSKEAITRSTLLTPAEMVAVSQLLSTGHQSLVIGTRGNAVGGTLSIGNALANSLINLVVPRRVEVLDAVGALHLSGDLTNSGKIEFTGGSRSTLSASDIFNYGSITSSVSLALIAGKIVNTGLISASNGDLNLRSGNITNAGTLAAITGNLNINTLSPMDIVINNSGGTLQALQGDINVRDASYRGLNNLTLNGGNVFSNNLNLYSGCGTVDVNVDQITSVVNVHAGEAHVVAASNNLTLGTMDITGDPSFYNSAGSVTIDGSLAFPGQSVAVVAKTNIVSGVTGSINTSSGIDNAGAITLVAGAKFTVSPGDTSSTHTSGQNFGAGDTVNTVKITGGTTTGGFIDLTGGTGAGGGTAPMTLNSTSSSGAPGHQDGGNVTLVAYGGTGANAGTINLPAPNSSAEIVTSGAGAGANGNVTMIAGSKTSGATAINTGGMNTLGGSGAGGVVTLSTALPIITGGTSVSIFSGAIQAGGKFAAGAIQPTSITLSNDANNNNGINASQITISAGKNLSWFGSGNLAADLTDPNIYGPFTVAFNPSGTYAYVTDFGSNNFPFSGPTPISHNLTVINTMTNVISNLTLGTMPSGVAFNPAGTLAYVTNYNAPNAIAGVGTVSMINATTNAVLPGTITVGQGPAAVEFNKTGTTAYVVNFISNTVSVINVATSKVTKTIPVGLNPDALVINQAGTFAYVANSNSGTISVINLKTNTVTATITGLNSPYNLSITPDGKFIYVANAGQPGSGTGVDTLSVINTATNKIVATINDPNGTPSGISVNSSGTFAYDTDYTLPGHTGTTFGVDGASTVNVINTVTNKVINTFDLSVNGDSFVNSIMFSPSGTIAYAANYNNSDPGPPATPQSTISVINIRPPVLNATTVTLIAGSKGGGSITAFTQTGTLTAKATGNVSVYNTGSVTLAANGTLHNSATGTYQLITTPDPISESGQIVINDAVTASGTNGTIRLQSSEGIGVGGITQVATASLTAQAVSLADALDGFGGGSGNGTIGILGGAISTNAQNLMANTTGNVFIKDSKSTTIYGASIGSIFSLTDTALAGGIKINSDVTATTSLDLITSAASGTVISQLFSSSVVTPVLAITLAGASTANLSATLLNNVGELSGVGTGKSSILLTTNSSLQLGGFGNSQNVTVTATGQISPGGPVPLGSLTATADSFSLGAQVIGLSTTSNVTLNATGPLGISQTGAGNIIAKSISLSAGAGTSIQQPGSLPLNVTASVVSVNTGFGSTALIRDTTTTAVQLSNSSVNGGTLQFASVGPLSTKGTVSAFILLLTSINGSVTGTTQAPYLIANAGAASTDNINLTNNGSVTLWDPASSSLTCNAGGNLTLNVNGTLTAFFTQTAGGSLSLNATSILLQSNSPNPTLVANNGNVLVHATSQALGSIIVQSQTSITATSTNPLLGNVIFSVGSANPPKVNTVTPANVTPVISNGGKIFYGVKGITSLNGTIPPTLGGNNTLTANGKNIIFSTGSAPATAIQLCGQDSISASGYQQDAPSDEDFIVDAGDDAV
jgi:YVTN family beta-propeller protein